MLENNIYPNICTYQKKAVILQAKLKSYTAYGIKQLIGGKLNTRPSPRR